MKAQWTVRSAIERATRHLRVMGVEEARLAAETLLAHVLGVDRLELYLQPERVLSAASLERYRELVRRRGEGVPVQHLVGEVSFWGLPFQVGPAAFIPRFETELLVECALRAFASGSDRPESGQGELRLLELGTGTGAVLIALLVALPQAHGVATDLSAEALALARANAARHNVAGRITLIQSDWFQRVEGRFDAILSNPPYVPSGQLQALPREVREHDPPLALDGGPDGLGALQAIISGAPRHLKPGGRLFLEVGSDQAPAVRDLLEAEGFQAVVVHRDLGGLERVVEATFSSSDSDSDWDWGGL